MTNKNISSPTAQKIFQAWEREGLSERARTYLGASSIGHDCDMWLWLNFRGVVKEHFSGRMYRLFDRGRREEAVFCSDLRKIGCEVKEIDELTGEQFAVSAFGGHFRGHLDGICRGLDEAPKQWFVCEFKTHSDASFKKLAKSGVKEAKPMHFAQMQVYMGLTELKKALYVAVNKDNDDLWCEVVDFNESAFVNIMNRASKIINTDDPERCAKRIDDFRCKACPAKEICWHEHQEIISPKVPVNCLTCCHSIPVTDGDASWLCGIGRSCSREGRCDRYLPIPALVKGEVVKYESRKVEYDFNGKKFAIGVGGLSVDDAQKISPQGVDSINKVQEEFPEAKIIGNNFLEKKYIDDKSMDRFTMNVSQLREWCDRHPFFVWNKPSLKKEMEGKKYFEYENDKGESMLLIVGNDSVEMFTNVMQF